MFFGVVLAGLIGLEDTGETIAAPLLATQILWINLLTDGAPALALGMDPPPDDVMRAAAAAANRPRHRRRDVGSASSGSAPSWQPSRCLRSTSACRAGSSASSGSVVEARTMAFTTLVLAQLFNCFNARSDRISAFHRLFTNRFLWGAVALSALLQIAVVQLPFLNNAFDTTPLGLTSG